MWHGPVELPLLQPRIVRPGRCLKPRALVGLDRQETPPVVPVVQCGPDGFLLVGELNSTKIFGNSQLKFMDSDSVSLVRVGYFKRTLSGQGGACNGSPS